MNMNDKITVLYPGSFKCVHLGHLSLINRYLSQSNVKNLKLLIGPGVRDGITQEISFNIAKILLEDNNKVIIEKVEYPSPVLTAFKFIETADPSTYALASSTKEDDYERVERFCKQHQIGGKYFDKVPEGVELTVLPVDVCPIKYIGRSDDKNGLNISSSVLRHDVINNDIENFKTNYIGINIDKILEIWNILKTCVK
jgi:hypothetical protein